jgi:hypothetical protein
MVAEMKFVVLMVHEVTTKSIRVHAVSLFERDQHIFMIMRDKILSKCQES